jgi:(E)-4-hydroxy-3-methylbut-2-enyl-diphosphate synthase
MKKSLTNQVMVGSVPVGGGSPIVVQSMTNTDTADVQKTVEQVFDLWKAGSEIVRVTVNNEASADAIPRLLKAKEKKLFCAYRGRFSF